MTTANRGELTVEAVSEDEPEALFKARTLLRPSMRAAITTAEFTPIEIDDIGLDALAQAMDEHTQAINKGDLKHAEAMLVSQAYSLDAIFHQLAWRANEQKQLKQYETMFRLAFKAQSQCARTLEALAKIKNPPIVYAKQANIANGPQQVNNSISPHAGETEKQKNELLEHTHGERLDTGTASTTSGINQNLETVETLDRT